MSETPTDLSFTLTDDGIAVTTVGLDRVTIEVDGVPHASLEVPDGNASLPLIDQWDQHQIEVVGYASTQVRQRRRLSH